MSLKNQVYLEATVCWLFLFQHDKFLSMNMNKSGNMRCKYEKICHSWSLAIWLPEIDVYTWCKQGKHEKNPEIAEKWTMALCLTEVTCTNEWATSRSAAEGKNVLWPRAVPFHELWAANTMRSCCHQELPNITNSCLIKKLIIQIPLQVKAC